MVYISVALGLEAKPIINYFKLKKDINIKKFQVFRNENITLIITGVGIIKSLIAITHIFTLDEVNNDSYLFNIGVCGSDKFEIGKIILANKVVDSENNIKFYSDMIVEHSFIEGSLESFNEVINDKEKIRCDIVDMEGAGVAKAGTYFLDNSRIFIIKIVSDNLENNVDYRNIEKLISDSIFLINKFIKSILKIRQNFNIEYSEKEIEIINKFLEKIHFTESMKNELLNLFKYYKNCDKDIIEILEKYMEIEIMNKNEVKKIINEIRKQIIE